ncbi:hypothetical protein Moror_12859 [Moniliophthora roreri MCA 2997]|uniref:Uncharacterized protein n=1 Tax=Moniliophthora roreri (strain MCA 2997) TaxID=1381753 RepID=V2X4E7_MONRO|nr:hypothetical protein Moror_12859 [Moniliophthora roreri MCA 2997]
MTHVSPALKSFGILPDGHLRTLLSLNDGYREGVVRGMSQFPAQSDLFVLAKHLKSCSAKMFTMVISTPKIACSPSIT